MRTRAIHLASLLLLIASMGSAEAATLREGATLFSSAYIHVLLVQQGAAATASQSALTAQPGQAPALDLQPAARALYRAPWTLHPPAAHSIGIQATSGSGL